MYISEAAFISMACCFHHHLNLAVPEGANSDQYLCVRVERDGGVMLVLGLTGFDEINPREAQDVPYMVLYLRDPIATNISV